jgi:hypothetical protein
MAGRVAATKLKLRRFYYDECSLLTDNNILCSAATCR